MRTIACPCRGVFILFLILCVCAWGGFATSALAQQDEPAYGTVALMHSDDHPALDTSVKSIAVKGFDQNGKIVYASSGLEPAAILTLEEVPMNCVALGIFYFDATNPSPIHMAKVGLERDGSGLAVITDPDLNALSSCTTAVWIVPPELKNLSSSDSSQDPSVSDNEKDLIKQPAVAISKNYVVLVWTHRENKQCQYITRVGKLGYLEDGSRQITWGSTQLLHDLGYYGCSAPNASLNDNDWLVVVGNDGEYDLYVSSFVCNVHNENLLACRRWEPTAALGKTPSISINNKGAGVLTYKSDIFNTLWYRLVYIDEENQKLTLMAEHQYDTGISPRVAINENGGVVEVHKSANLFRWYDLWLNVGVIDFGNNTIKWGKSQRFETYGWDPVAALTDDGVMMEAHYVKGSSPEKYKVYYRNGLVDFDNKLVTWQGGSVAHELRDQSFWPALSVNGLGELATFLYDTVSSYQFFGLGELRQQTACPWPSVFTHEPYDIWFHEAKSGGKVVYQGQAAVTQRGVCWSRRRNPTIDDNITIDGDGLGTFSSQMDRNLKPGLYYHVRAYAKNKKGVGYGQQMTFKMYELGN